MKKLFFVVLTFVSLLNHSWADEVVSLTRVLKNKDIYRYTRHATSGSANEQAVKVTVKDKADKEVFAKEINIREIQNFNIFDRWGEHVFSANNFQPNDPTINWDGTLQGKKLNPGIFAWFMEVELMDGDVVQLTGDVMLVH